MATPARYLVMQLQKFVRSKTVKTVNDHPVCFSQIYAIAIHCIPKIPQLHFTCNTLRQYLFGRFRLSCWTNKLSFWEVLCTSAGGPRTYFGRAGARVWSPQAKFCRHLFVVQTVIVHKRATVSCRARPVPTLSEEVLNTRKECLHFEM